MLLKVQNEIYEGNVKGLENYILILEYHLIAKQYFMHSNISFRVGVKLYIETFYVLENNTMPSDLNRKWLLRKYIVISFIIFMLNINKSFTAWEELPAAMRNILYFLTCLCTLDFGRSIEVHI